MASASGSRAPAWCPPFLKRAPQAGPRCCLPPFPVLSPLQDFPLIQPKRDSIVQQGRESRGAEVEHVMFPFLAHLAVLARTLLHLTDFLSPCPLQDTARMVPFIFRKLRQETHEFGLRLDKVELNQQQKPRATLRPASSLGLQK